VEYLSRLQRPGICYEAAAVDRGLPDDMLNFMRDEKREFHVMYTLCFFLLVIMLVPCYGILKIKKIFVVPPSE
jgi:hypothetical protein